MSPPQKIRVVIADDNKLMRLGIRSLLDTQADIEVVGEAVDGPAAVTAFKQHQPDVLLLDLKMPVMDGVHVSRMVLDEFPKARIVVLSHYEGDEHIFQAIRAGAKGYVTKDMDSDRILEAIRAAFAGHQYLPAALMERLTERLRKPELTFREQQCLEAIYKGLSNREIAKEMGISEKTVGIYVGNILSKMGAHTRTEAVNKGLQSGLLPPPKAP